MNAMWRKSYGWVALMSLVILTRTLVGASSIQPVALIGSYQSSPIGGNGDSFLPQITGDGRFILFASAAGNLVTGPTNTPLPSAFPHRMNVFLRDRSNSLTTLVSFNLTGTAGGNGDSIPVGGMALR